MHLDHPHLVILSIPNEYQLKKNLNKIRELGIKCVPFYEADIGNELTAFATEPIFEEGRHVFKKFNCMKIKPVTKEELCLTS